MKPGKFLPFLLILPLLVAACAPTARAGAPKDTAANPAACPTTLPQEPAFIPPEPFPTNAAPDHFWYGTASLWTQIPANGVWQALPKSDTGYTQKVFFWSQGYDVARELQPALTLTGRRLDGEAPPLDASPATNGYAGDTGQFMLVGVEIPTEGCWELTAAYTGQTLTFVIKLEP